jgi:hypothetical protein
LKLIITVDTEADNQWNYGCPLTTKNVGYWRPFQKLCERYAIHPTYLITSEIATDPQAIAFLRPLVESDQVEVGAHLHPWTTPPFRDEPGLRFNDPLHAYPSELDPDLFANKLETLTGQIESAINRRPTSFRAGRFGINPVCAGILKQSGYIVDSSITPLVSWKKIRGIRTGGPDFSREKSSIFKFGHGFANQILEMPVTILFTIEIFKKFPALLRGYQLLQKLQSNKLIGLNLLTPQPLWMRPLPRITIGHLISGLRSAKKQGLQNVTMMFHSSELMPGGSIYRPDNASVIQLLQLLEEFFVFLTRENVESETLTGAAIKSELN